VLQLPFERLEDARREERRRRSPADRLRDAVDVSRVVARLAAASPRRDAVLLRMEAEEEEEFRLFRDLFQAARG
jgi:hypothetical protein